MMRLLMTVALGLAALLAACGGGGGSGDDDRVLVLASASYTESEYRAQIRADIILAPRVMEGLCKEAERTTDFESFFELVGRVDAAEAVQEPVQADRERAFEIIKEECGRTF